MPCRPQHLPRKRIQGHDLPRTSVIERFAHRPRDALHIGKLRRSTCGVHAEKQGAVVQQNLFSRRCLLIGSYRFSGRCIQSHQRAVQVQGDVDGLVRGDQAARQLGGAALQGPQMRVPLVDRPPPKDRPVKRVASDQRPLGRREDRDRRGFVQDREHTSARRHHGADTGHAVVMPGVQRAAHPLQPPRGPDDGVARHGVVGGAVQVVRPIVDFRRPRLDQLAQARTPCATGQDGHSLGAEDS